MRNLRLLDLDRHPECPRLASHLFKDSDAPDDKRVRVERVEWLLYHVFEQWDTVNTAEVGVNPSYRPRLTMPQRLQPYFPPLEPRQSTGLHAALFRWLSELKRDGVLARPVQLRNGMLDECKGDAVLPLLLAFSTAALRKSTTKRLGPSVGLRLAHDDFLPRRDQLLLEPLLLAHRASLAGELHRRREQGRRYEELDGLLRSKLSGIAQRFEKLETDADDVDALRPAEADALRRRFEDHWLGDPAWLDVVISGYHQGRSDPLLIAPFDDVWQHAKSETIKQLQAGSQRGLLEKLEERLRTQQGRIEHWKAFHNALSGEKRGESVTRALSTGAVIPQQAPDPPLEARRCSADEGTARGPAPGPDESLPSSISGDDADASDWDTASDDEKGEPSKESSPHGGALDGRRPDEVLISDEKLGQKGKKGNIVHDADANLTDEADHLSISKPPITVVKDNDQARSADKQTEKISNKKSDTDGMSAMQIETGMRSQYKAGRLSPLGPEEQELLAEQVPRRPARTAALTSRLSLPLLTPTYHRRNPTALWPSGRACPWRWREAMNPQRHPLIPAKMRCRGIRRQLDGHHRWKAPQLLPA